MPHVGRYAALEHGLVAPAKSHTQDPGLIPAFELLFRRTCDFFGGGEVLPVAEIIVSRLLQGWREAVVCACAGGCCLLLSFVCAQRVARGHRVAAAIAGLTPQPTNAVVAADARACRRGS
jgi:hypothetical protein